MQCNLKVVSGGRDLRSLWAEHVRLAMRHMDLIESHDAAARAGDEETAQRLDDESATACHTDGCMLDEICGTKATDAVGFQIKLMAGIEYSNGFDPGIASHSPGLQILLALLEDMEKASGERLPRGSHAEWLASKGGAA